MSVRKRHRSTRGTPIYSQGFSSKSMGSHILPKTSAPVSVVAPVMVVATDQSLLESLNLEIDPSVISAYTQEKEQIRTQNNRFISFIDKVRTLEHQNQMLQTKWKLLNEQTDSHSNIESKLKLYITHLERKLDDLMTSNKHCEEQREALHHQVEEYRERYEQECNTRSDAENAFVLLKQEVDIATMSTANLHQKLSLLENEQEFLKTLHDEELHEQQQRVAPSSVVVEMDNCRKLNMDDIMLEVKAHYKSLVAHGREEVESWHKAKLNHMAAEASRNDTELHDNKNKVTELKENIRRIEMEIQAVSSEISSSNRWLAEVEQRGDKAVMEAKSHIKDLEQALRGAKLGMAKQIRDYQGLVDVKMGLEMEISTYMKLLEEEEKKIQNPSFLNIKAGVARAVTPVQAPKSGALLIKIIETQDVTYS
uniref:Si:dkey-222n6.2 n=1 Tax=Oryzias latipes TaxID=8090 RepID=A0A3P9JK93_ORYLA